MAAKKRKASKKTGPKTRRKAPAKGLAGIKKTISGISTRIDSLEKVVHQQRTLILTKARKAK